MATIIHVTDLLMEPKYELEDLFYVMNVNLKGSAFAFQEIRVYSQD